MTPHQFVVVSLWVAHTFVYQRFTVTPRLMVTSPVRGCGKTTLLDLLEAMCVRPLKSDSITAASISHAVDREHPPLLIRQADNWRPLIAIADAFGAAWAMRAREAAVLWAGQHQDEDAAVVLLRDIRDTFDARGVDRLPSKTMVDHLNGADDAAWSEWRGSHGNR